MKNELQNYLTDTETTFKQKLEFFTNKNVSVQSHNDYSSLFQFCLYDNNSEPNPIIDICSGIILDVDNADFNIVCATPKVIHSKTPLTGKRLKYEEKLDGTTVYLWYYKDKWQLSTKYDAQELKIEKLFFKYFTKKYISQLDKCYTYTFELCSPFNKKIINFNTVKIYFITAIHNKTLEEERFKNFEHMLPPSFKFADLKEAYDFVQNSDPKLLEGLIVSDAKNNKIKIKNKNFRKLQNFVETFDFKKGIAMVVKGQDDMVEQFPEIQDLFREMKKMVNGICTKYDTIFEICSKNCSSKNDFSSRITTHTNFTSPLYAMYDKRVKNMKDYLQKMNVDKLVMMMEKGEI